MLTRKSILKKKKKAQEELAGFALILVLLGIILLAFLVASLRKSNKDSVENYEVNNFLQAVLQQTTGCEINGKFLAIKDLIFKCEQEATCLNGDACTYLTGALEKMVGDSWIVGETSPYKGYELAIILNGDISANQEGEPLIETMTDGITSETDNTLNNYGSSQEFSKAGDSITIYFTVFYDK